MQLHSKTLFGILSASLLLAATSAPALTLGRLRGSVLLGQALDVSVAVQTAADEDRSSICFDADVSYGETPLEHSLVTVNAQPGPQAGSQTVRISSSVKVDEAVISVTLKAGCGAKATRRYVLLSDALSDAVAAPSPERVPVASAVSRAPVQAVSAPVAEPGKPQAAPVANKKADGALLKLAPLASRPPQQAAAQAAMALNTAAIDQLQRRVEAIEKLQAAQASAEPSLQNEARTTALTADIDSLRLATSKNLANLQAIAAKLEAQPSADYAKPLVWVLAALLAACVMVLAYLVLRLRNGSFAAAPWWSGGEDRPLSLAGEPASTPVPAGSANRDKTVPANLVQQPDIGAADQAEVTGSGGIQSQPVDLQADTVRSTALMEMEVATRPSPALSGPAPLSSPPAVPSGAQGATKALNPGEMLDVRQQAEFFMALGQHDEAVLLLESSIRDSVDANPLIFLDLLEILHTLHRRDDFEQYRSAFNLQFTGRVLDYANFLSEGNGLEAYEDISQQIIVLWPTEYTIDFIEQCLVRTQEDDPEQGLDLEAFKDLLLLYGVLRRMDQSSASGYVPFSAGRVTNPPGGMPGQEPSEPAQSAGMGETPLPPVSEYPATAGVDLDLEVDLELDLDLDLDIDLDINLDASDDQSHPSVKNNLIEFDMSGYVKPDPSKAPKP